MSNIKVSNNGNHSIFYKNEGKLFSIPRGVNVETIIITTNTFTIHTIQNEIYELSSILKMEEKSKLLELLLSNVRVVKVLIGNNDIGRPVWDDVLPMLFEKGIYINKYGAVVKLNGFDELCKKINDGSNPIYINYLKKLNNVSKEDLMKEIIELKQLLKSKGII